MCDGSDAALRVKQTASRHIQTAHTATLRVAASEANNMRTSVMSADRTCCNAAAWVRHHPQCGWACCMDARRAQPQAELRCARGRGDGWQPRVRARRAGRNAAAAMSLPCMSMRRGSPRCRWWRVVVSVGVRTRAQRARACPSWLCDAAAAAVSGHKLQAARLRVHAVALAAAVPRPAARARVPAAAAPTPACRRRAAGWWAAGSEAAAQGTVTAQTPASSPGACAPHFEVKPHTEQNLRGA
jgi:hypothetical protein